jgi:hypothetical protein
MRQLKTEYDDSDRIAEHEVEVLVDTLIAASVSAP